MFFHNITDIMTDKPRHLLKWNFLFLLIKHMKGKKKSPVKSSFNKEACAAIYLQGKNRSRSQTKNTLFANTDIPNIVSGGKKIKEFKK